jgi:FkbM family methyltransferase
MIKVLISRIVEVISRILIVLKKHSRVVNQFNKLRSETHKKENHSNLISKLLGEKKLVALDVGAQGGFFNANIFSKKYNFFFDLIAVEPIPEEAKKLEEKNYKVISKGLWSENCKKKLYILGKRPGSSSMYKPNPEVLSLYDFKEKDFSIFDITDEIDIECTTIEESLDKFKVNNLDLLKIDTQGSELEILKGMGNYFPLLMKIEAQIIPMYKNVPSWTELVNYLHKINYMTCEWIEIGKHVTRTPAEMDMIFIPNYLTEFGKKIIKSREKEFISSMLIFGHIRLLQNISSKLNFTVNSEIQKLKDKFFQ